MKLVWCSWKDTKHPQAGGAELITHNLLKRLAQGGHEVILLTSRPEGAAAEETIAGYKVIRQGNRYTVYPKVRQYFTRQLADWPDVVIDEINTIPFFTKRFSKKPSLIFIHQLAREVWFYQMFWPLSWIGYAIEPLYLRTLAAQQVITISESTKADLLRVGFKPDRIRIIREGITMTPLKSLDTVKKYPELTLLSLGAVRPMKRTLEIVQAFEHAALKLPGLRLIVAGNNQGLYGKKVLDYIAKSPYRASIMVLGGVSDEKRLELMQRAHAFAITSVKEGWGLTVTEANSQGTPVVAYDVDGLRDSVKNGITGIIAQPSPASLGSAIVSLLKDDTHYQQLRKAAWQDAKQYTFENSYKDFLDALTAFGVRL